MANDGLLIETISKQAFDDMNALIAKLNEQIKLTNDLTGAFKQVKLPSQVTKAQKDTASAVKETNKAVSDYTKTLRTLENAQKKQLTASTQLGKDNEKIYFNYSSISQRVYG